MFDFDLQNIVLTQNHITLKTIAHNQTIRPLKLETPNHVLNQREIINQINSFLKPSHQLLIVTDWEAILKIVRDMLCLSKEQDGQKEQLLVYGDDCY